VSHAWILWLLAVTPPAPAWEELYQRPGTEKGLAAVWADEAGWFAAGTGVMITGGAGPPQAQALGPRSIVSFSGVSRSELFAVGREELVLKLAGTKWIEEHLVTGPVADDHGPRGDLLEQVTPLLIDVQQMPAAVGPWQVLVRHPDGTWQALPEVPRQRVLRLAHEGPREARPAGCALNAWSWVAKDRGVFSCRDRRAFVFGGGKATPVGRLPRSCPHPSRARTHGSDVYTLCGGGLWRWDRQRWQRVTGPSELRDFAVTERCLYVVTERAVWRRCGPQPLGTQTFWLSDPPPVDRQVKDLWAFCWQ
jgi:hypothetical protein